MKFSWHLKAAGHTHFRRHLSAAGHTIFPRHLKFAWHIAGSLTALGCATTPASPARWDAAHVSVSADRKTALREMVQQDCGSCHGLRGTGGLGRPLVREVMKERSAAALELIILEGIPGTAMPRWRGVLSRDEAQWIAAGLQQGEFF
jgi:cytochrome c55X